MDIVAGWRLFEEYKLKLYNWNLATPVPPSNIIDSTPAIAPKSTQ